MERVGVRIVFACGVAAIVLRTLLDSDFATSTLVYILVPFVFSAALYFLVPSAKGEGVVADFLNHLRIVTIGFLLTSAFLFEGFICVLMFMPIYYFLATLAFVFAWLLKRREDKNRLQVVAIPALVLVAAAEGLIPATTFEREEAQTFSAYSPQSVAELKANMAEPITFSGERHWFLKLFPLPDRVEASSLAAGDVHKLHFTYRRWGFTNVHKGEMHVKITEVGTRTIATEITRNDSYLANYLDVHGTRIRFEPVADGGTKIHLTVLSRRTLDPVWYFGPVQQLATKNSARFFIEEIIARHPVEELE
ncbi:hypothetical protein [Qipengyuania sphaerica]|uniref:hypothetical protein n=1 Tax=Qipengyuania sphaerica TaxID=2867243 RepID=UPI001C86D55B|nr:hypothetical protein [Qipengyuania sphaerica]MBX7541653.1 hypothetical protein [Qipengyuania sphaerica]